MQWCPVIVTIVARLKFQKCSSLWYNPESERWIFGWSTCFSLLLANIFVVAPIHLQTSSLSLKSVLPNLPNYLIDTEAPLTQSCSVGKETFDLTVKVRTFWEAHIIWKNLPHGFDMTVNQLIWQNHEDDFFKFCVFLEKSEL